MEGDEVVGVVHHASGDQRFAAAHAFFGGLEYEADGAAEGGAVGGNEGGDGEADGAVAVVSAGVHAAGIFGAEAAPLREVVGRVAFVDGQGVHVHAQDGGRAGFAAVPIGDDGGVAVFEGVKPGGVGAVCPRPSGVRGGGCGVRFAHDGGLTHDVASQAQAVAEARQFGGNAGCGADFEEALFGIAVEVAPPSDELLFE